jgi:opacity protein-like surface antigen
MKKVLLIVALLTISLTLAFSQASVGGWGRGLFTIAGGGDDLMAINRVSWGGAPRIGFTISGSSDNIGAQLDITGDGGTIGLGDQRKIWAKPIEMLTITIGKAFDDALRGSASFCAYNWMRPNGITGDDAVFLRVCNQFGWAGTSFIVALDPAPGAHVYAGFGGILGGSGTFEDVAMMGQYGAGYDIAGIGLIRAQYIGRSVGDEVLDLAAWGDINAAFKLTMVEGLMLDIGAFIPTDSDQAGYVATVSLYGNYVMDTITLHLSGDVTLFDSEVSEDPAFGVGIGAEYGLADGPTIQADVRYRNDIAMGNEDGMIAGLLAAKWSYSNGIFGVGIQFTNDNFAGGDVVKNDPADIVFALPIRLEYWF